LAAGIKLRLFAEFPDADAIGTDRNGLARKTVEVLSRYSAPGSQQMAYLLRKMFRLRADLVHDRQ